VNMILNELRPLRILVAVDFSDCCKQALKVVIRVFDCRPVEIILLHVIDDQFINEFIKYCPGEEADLKKRLFNVAKKKLDVMAEEDQLTDYALQKIVCRGIPYREINRHAEKYDVDFVVIGSCGMAGDPEAIFFGGTTERVMRFITRPIFCIPPYGKKKR
jgi:nucleotide-binding universal stress UspA family protein